MLPDLPVLEIVHVVASLAVGACVVLYLVAACRWVRRWIGDRNRSSGP